MSIIFAIIFPSLLSSIGALYVYITRNKEDKHEEKAAERIALGLVIFGALWFLVATLTMLVRRY